MGVSVNELDRLIKKKYVCGDTNTIICIFRKLLYNARTWYFDMTYIPIPLEILNEALSKWKAEVLPTLKYQSEIWDCDDYASYLKGWLQRYLVFEKQLQVNGVGIALGVVYDENGEVGGHAWNIVLLEKPVGAEVKFIEPQTGQLFDDSTDKWRYVLEAVII